MVSNIPYTYFIPKVKSFIKQRWQNDYDHKHFRIRPLKIHEIVPSIRPLMIYGLKRKDEVIIHRIRIGHTRLTHSYLMENGPVPECRKCDANAVLSVRHILIECLHYAIVRSRYFPRHL